MWRLIVLKRSIGECALRMPTIQLQPPTIAAIRKRFRCHYAVLDVKPTATLKDIKAAYLKKAKSLHPDVVNPSESHLETFNDVISAYEVLSNKETRLTYDKQLEDEQRTGIVKQHAVQESPLEKRLRLLIEAGDVDAAVELWRGDEASLRILLHIIEVCHRNMKIPTNLPKLLEHLHAAEPHTRFANNNNNVINNATNNDNFNNSNNINKNNNNNDTTTTNNNNNTNYNTNNNNNDNDDNNVNNNPNNNTNNNNHNNNDNDAQSIVVFTERKTKAYNDLIRMCDACGTKENVFEVLDAMEVNRIQMDMGTMLALEEIFTLGVKRAPSPAERRQR